MPREFTYTVRGHWPFPIDMLRHDGSHAATEADQAMIDRLSSDHAPDRAAFEDVEINLVGPFKQNTARWESFSWSVPSDDEAALYKAADRRRKEEQAIFDGALAKLSQEERDVITSRLHR